MGDRSVMWFRRDLRLADNPALVSAIASADDGVVPLFVVDDRLWKRSGAPRLAYLCDSLRSLRERIGGLVIRHGDPASEVPEVAGSVGAVSVHIADDWAPTAATATHGSRRCWPHEAVPLVREGSAYAVPPDRSARRTGRPTGSIPRSPGHGLSTGGRLRRAEPGAGRLAGSTSRVPRSRPVAIPDGAGTAGRR